MSGKKSITRRGFIGTAGVAAGATIVGCDPAGSDGAAPGSGPGGKADDPTAADGPIVSAVIHPGIGVARVGNSPTDFLIGPEVTTPAPRKEGQSRDAAGALKRQAARFRIYGLNAQGQVVRELTADDDDVDIEWTVHLANKKASWYRFLSALDIPEAADTKCPRRNASVGDRQSLEIDPGPRTISGTTTSGPEHALDGGAFRGVPVSVGELQTDAAGRLLVLSGLGLSGSPSGAPVFDPAEIDTFNNADDWFDDTADGPVDATVLIEGEEIPVEGAWAIVAPPNYAPDVIGWRTLYDLLIDTYVDAGMIPMPDTTSFTHDVLPILQRLTNLQWVNKGFADTFGAGGEFDFDDPALIEVLAGRTGNTAIRREMFAAFRPEVPADTDRNPWPWIYGDAFGSFDESPRVNLGLSGVRGVHLMRWTEGEFVDDWDPDAAPPQSLDEVPIAEQPAMLDRAALHYCLADAFHPGCELTWPVRHASMYSAPFRIKRREPGQSATDLGDVLTADNAGTAGGPLQAQGPGELTRWMALPWQGDTVFCRSGYDPDFDPFIPSFWPARVPNHVLTEQDYAIVMSDGLPRQARLEAFSRRRHWVRAMQGGPPGQIHQMIREFGRMGVVEERPGPLDDLDFPARMLVESLPLPDFGPQNAAGPASAGEPPLPDPDDPVAQAGWDSQEQLDAFRKLLGLD